MKEVSMMPVVTVSRIGVYPDGSPVVYDPEKAAAKRAELAEKQDIKTGQPLFIQSAHIGVHPDGSPVVYKPELKEDTVELSEAKNQPKMYMLKQPMMMAKVSPVEVIGWIEVLDKGYKVLKPVIVDIYDSFWGGKNAVEQSKETDTAKPSFEEIA